MSENNTKRRRPHAVCIPYPAQGHITPMLKLAKLLNSTHNFHISFINNHHNHRRLLQAHGPESLSGLPSIRFHVISDGLPRSENPDAIQDIATLCNSLIKTGPHNFRHLLSELNSAEDAPPVSCVVVDTGMDFAVAVAEELGLPVARFWTASACGLLGYAQYERLIQTGIFPLKDSSCLTDGYLDKVVEGIPSMESITLKDLPSYIRTADVTDFMLNFVINVVSSISTSRCPIILNTFEALEGPTLQTLANAKITSGTVFPIGPLSLHLNITEDYSTIRSSLLQEHLCCVPWLDAKPRGSVIYINFGSITTLTVDQVNEFAWGLINSMVSFLWVIRPDLLGSNEPGLATREIRQLMDGVKGRGMVASWCDQERVLAHPSVGGFLTHCGWNSTLETLGFGVPVLLAVL